MKESVIETRQIEINKNVLRYEDSVIQISNISGFSVGPEPQEEYPKEAIIGLLIGICMVIISFKLGNLMAVVLLLGILISIICGLKIASIYENNSNLGEYLIIDLNCGKSLYFICKNRSFLRKVVNAMKDCFNRDDIQCKIDFNKCDINVHDFQISRGDMFQNSTVVQGNSNTNITGVGENNRVENVNTTITSEITDWEKAAGIFEDLAGKYLTNSEEELCCSRASKLCKEEDSDGLKRLILDKQDIFKNILFRAASTGISEIIKKLIDLVI